MPNLEKQKEIFFKVHDELKIPKELAESSWPEHPAIAGNDPEMAASFESATEEAFTQMIATAAQAAYLQYLFGQALSKSLSPTEEVDNKV